MASHDDGSVTRWIGDLKAGGDCAAQHLWEHHGRLRDRLRTVALRQALDLRLDGHTLEEIAQRLGCAERAGKRELNVIRDGRLPEES